VGGGFGSGGGWTLSGAATIADGALTVGEGDATIASAQQTFAVPDQAETLTVRLSSALLADAATPPDAFEVALLGADGLSLVGTVDLTATDAAANLQDDGTLRLAPGVQATPPVTEPDGTVSRDIIFDLSALPGGTEATLFLQLVGFGPDTSTVVVDEVILDAAELPLTAFSGSVEAEEDTPLIIDFTPLLRVPEGVTPSIEILSGPSAGTLTLVGDTVWRYEPDANANGIDTLSFRATGGGTVTEPATLTIDVEAINDLPVLTVPAEVTVLTGDVLNVTAQATDVEPGDLTFSLSDAPLGASINPDTGALRWTCLLYTSDAADDMQCVDLGGRRIIKKKT